MKSNRVDLLKPIETYAEKAYSAIGGSDEGIKKASIFVDNVKDA